MTVDATSQTTDTPIPGSPRPGMGLIKAYLGLYAILIVVGFAFMFTAGQPLSTAEFWKQTFPGVDPAGSAELTEADFDDEHGHLLLWEDISFQIDKQRYAIPADEKISVREAIAIGTALRTLPTEAAPRIVVNKYHLMYSTWSYGLTIYNLLGLFLLLIVFLRDPLAGFLDAQRVQTVTDLEHARDARKEAERIEARRQEILAEVEAKRQEMEATAEEEFAEERTRIIESARHEAKGMLDNLQDRLNAEVAHAAKDLRREVTEEAHRLARQIVEKQADDSVHRQALDSFVKDVRKAKIG